MTAYLIRRIGTSIVILIGISIFVFILLHSIFPSPAIVILGPKATPKAVAAWNAEMTLPILCIALLVLAGYSRYMRSSAMETLAQDYIKTARAKGLPERLVLFRHLLRNACLPMITLIGLPSRRCSRVTSSPSSSSTTPASACCSTTA
jgi:peptide/nickel transport system permease protein